MEFIKKLLCGVKKLLTQVSEKHSLKKIAVITGTVVTTAAVGVMLSVMTSSEPTESISEGSEVIQEDATDQSEDPLSGEPSGADRQQIPSGFLGVIEGVNATKASNGEYHPIGTNVEDVLVGQRIAKREEVSKFNAEEYVEESVNSIDDQSWELVENTKISDKDYETLLAIVEAEAGGEDIKGRILVANVVFNRVASSQFPDTVTEVVWDQSGGSPQFSPTADGRIGTVTVSDSTREAVNRAIDGEDYSEGALFFIERAYAEQKNVAWFDANLHYLFEHGCHSFYTY